MSSQASSSSRRPSVATAVNKSLACRQCRKSRSFCTRDRPACMTCRNRRVPCVYPKRRNVRDLEARVAELEAALEAYEGSTSTQPSPEVSRDPRTPSGPETTSFDHAESDDDLDLPSLTNELDNLVIGSFGTPKYLGVSSSLALGRKLRDVVGMAGAYGDGGLGLDCEVTTYDRDALRLYRLPSAEDTCDLPSVAKAELYFKAQYTMIGTIFAFVTPEFFWHHLRLAYYGSPDPGDQEACLAHCQVLMILAFGKMYAVNENLSGSGAPPGFEYFTQALQYLPSIHEEPSVTFCGVLALIGYFMQNLNRRDAAFLYVGLAQRMAISLAMHEEVSVLNEDEISKEQKRRTWWSIYSLDRILCVKYGHPVTMHDEDIRVHPPSRLNHEAEYCPAVVLRHYTVLSKILGQILSRIYRPASKPGVTYMSAALDIFGSLTAWEEAIPDELRFDPDRLTTSRESVSTFLHYNQCINMTARPLLFNIVEKRIRGGPTGRRSDWRIQRSRDTIVIIERCIAAARSSIAMMAAAAERNLLAVFGYMDGEHVFSAAMILVMVGVAFPADESTLVAMDDALTLLATMQAKGNHHIAARRALLVELSSVIERPASQQQYRPREEHQHQHHQPQQERPTEPAASLLDFDGGVWDELVDGDPMMLQAAAFDLELPDTEFDVGDWIPDATEGAGLMSEQYVDFS